MDGASPHFARLAAHPRPAGGPAAANARDYCAGVLRAHAFAIKEHSFEFSAFPGSWAAPLAGAATSLTCIALFLGRHVPGMTIAGIAFAAAAFIALRALGTRGVLGFGVMRRHGVNLEATRGQGEPAVWLVAHVDSKWQPVSMVARVAGVIVSAVAGGALLVTTVIPSVGDRAAAILLILAWLGSIPLMLSIVRDHGPGAVDNASGVATVLEAAALIPDQVVLGVLITDAEELDLAGARAWVRSRTPCVALNCDSIDDDGRLAVMHTNPAPPELISACERAAGRLAEPIRIIRLLPGVLTDSVALAGAGWRTVTLSKGSIRTLQRIHTARDSLESMRGTGIPGAARMLAAIVSELG